jgi:hypothetical protein
MGRLFDYGSDATKRHEALMQDTDLGSADAHAGNHAPKCAAQVDSGGVGGVTPATDLAAPIEKPKSSGYARLKARHRMLIAEHEQLNAGYAELELALDETTTLLEQSAAPRNGVYPSSGVQSLFSRGAR